MSMEIFKKTAAEKAEIRKAKKQWMKDIKAVNPLATNAKCSIGLKPVYELRNLKVLLELAEMAKKAVMN